MKTIYERLDDLIPEIQRKSFRENKGLGNEIGFYVFDYEPEHEMLVRNHIAFLKEKFNNGNSGFKIKEFDLYEIMLNILDSKGYLDKNIEMEAAPALYARQNKHTPPHQEKHLLFLGHLVPDLFSQNHRPYQRRPP
jgi:hypothetical protein